MAPAVSERHMQLSPTLSPDRATIPLLHRLSCFNILLRETTPTIIMEAVAALGVVSSVIAIADFAAKLTTTTGKLIKSAGDALPENEWIEEVTARNRDLALDLDRTSNVAGPLNKIDSAVAKLAKRFLLESAALTSSLQELKVPRRFDGTKSTRAAVKVVFRTMLRQGDLERRHEKLVRLERQLSALLLHSIRTSQLEAFEELRHLVERNGRDCVTVVRDSHTVLTEKLRALQVNLSNVELSIGRVEQRQLDARERERVADLLQSLAYNGMDARKDMIVDPISSTYDWAFEDDTQPTKQWLDSSVQNCWISGEPGTGKSVFTKSFRLDRRTVSTLQARTGKDNLLILDHYFWIAGDHHQRSLRAMLQHLCFQSIQQYGSLAKIAFPDEWKSRMPLRGMGWTTSTLVAALERIAMASGFRACIMVDGLDECESKERHELIRLLLNFAKTTDARLCVSSRLWPDFENAFSAWPRLKLPENNSWDVFQLICRRLELADVSTFRMCMGDVRLFDITCTGRDKTLRYSDNYVHYRESLDPAQRLIHDLCVKADGSILWVTDVLDTICERLADGQSVIDVMRYIDDLPDDVEDYYYNLVYTRIHSTYRMGQVSECAMALKLVSSLENSFCLDIQRFELVWALQASIGTGSGVAHDPGFYTSPLSLKSAGPLDQKVHQAVSAFVSSRCKDLMLASIESNGQGRLEYQHRVIYDFLSSKKMQSVVDSAVPEHFRAPQFTLHLGIVAARQVHECDMYRSTGPSRRRLQLSDASPGWILADHLDTYLSSLEGPLDETALQASSELATSINRSLTSSNQVEYEECNFDDFISLTMFLASTLVRLQQFGLISDLIHLGSEQAVDHVLLTYAKDEDPLSSRSWLGVAPSSIRQVVSTREAGGTSINLALGRVAPCYLPCVYTSWTEFLLTCVTKKVVLDDDERPVWSWARAIAYMARAFLNAGASIEVEICVGDRRCHGHICVCPDPSTHNGLYECPEPHPARGHKHDWINVKDLLLNNLEITKAELLQIEARNRSTGSVSQADILKLAAETEGVWQRHVKACVHDSIPVLDSGGRYSWIAEMYGSDSETNGTGSETDENDSEFT